MTIEQHMKVIKYLQELYKGNKFFVECAPTVIGARRFPDSNFAVKEIDIHGLYKKEENDATEKQD